MPEEPREYLYDAFISYRHVEDDRKWAEWLSRELEGYQVPPRFSRRPARRRRGLLSTIDQLTGLSAREIVVFRDEEELPASANLSAAIDTALQQSRFLIVVCSPRTPESAWVNREAERFRELGRGDNILALLIEGEPEQSFPPALREIRHSVVDRRGETREEIEEIEPLAADVRRSRKESRRYLKRMAMLRFMACLLGCGFDELRQRDQSRLRKKQRILGAGLAVVLAALMVLGSLAWLNRERAGRQERLVRAQELTVLAELLLEGEPHQTQHSALLAIEALSIAPEPLPSAQLALRRAISLLPPRAHGFDVGETCGRVLWTTDGSHLITEHGSDWRIHDATTGELAAEFSAPAKFASARPSLDGKSLVVGPPGLIQIRSLADGSLLSELRPRGEVTSQSMSQDQTTLAVLSRDADFFEHHDMSKGIATTYWAGTLRTYDMDSGRPNLEIGRRLFVKQALGLSGDGARVAFIEGEPEGPERLLRVLDTATRRELWRRSVGKEVKNVRMSPDGRFVAAWSRIPHWYEVYDLREERAIALPTVYPLQSISFSPRGSCLGIVSGMQMDESRAGFALERGAQTGLGGTGQGQAVIVELPGGAIISTLPHYGEQPRLVFSGDGRRALISSWLPAIQGETFTSDYALLVWDLVHDRRLACLPYVGPTCPASFSPDGDRVVGVEWKERSRVVVWDLALGEEPRVLHHSMPVLGVSVSPDGEWLTTAAQITDPSMVGGNIRGKEAIATQRISFWSGDATRELNELSGVGIDVRHCPGGDVFATLDGRETALWRGLGQIWAIGDANGELRVDVVDSLAYNYGTRPSEKPRNPGVHAPSFSRDGGFATFEVGLSRRVVDLGTGALTSFLSTGSNELNTVIAREAASAVSIESTGHVRFFKGLLERDPYEASGVGVEPYQRVALPDAGDLKGPEALQVIPRIREGEDPTAALEGYLQSVRSMSSQYQRTVLLDREESLCIVINSDAVFAYDLQTCEVLARFPVASRIVAAEQSFYGDRLAILDGDNVVRVVDPVVGEEVWSIEGDGSILVVGWSADGRCIATGDRLGNVRVWDVLNQQQIAWMKHDGAVMDLAFTPDGAGLLTGSADATARLWTCRTEDLLERVPDLILGGQNPESWERILDAEEWARMKGEITASN